MSAGAGSRWRHRARVAVALAVTTIGVVLQRWVPMSRWGFLLGSVHPVPEVYRGAEVARRVTPASPAERDVARAVARAVARSPWSVSCLAQAVAAQVMLRRVGEPGAVLIGLRRPAPGEPATPWPAHAWLRGREGPLTGGAAADGFVAATMYAVPGTWPTDLLGDREGSAG